jgi:RNA polymerase sigma-70 factor (ECF subfamily)
MTDEVPPDVSTPDARDRECVALWAQGDRHAGDELVKRYFQPICHYFRRRVGDEQEDLVQITFINLNQSLVNYRGEGSVRAFIYAIARNILRDYLRKVMRGPELDTYTTSMGQAQGRQPSSMLRESEEHRLLLDALQDISIEDFELLTLYYWDEMTGPELSELYESPEGTIRSRIRGALGRLHQCFTKLSELPRERQPTEELVEQWLSGLRYWWRERS